ncbi:MAG TPA: regulatory signaling modulator protein AmpE [Gammaproteobacteria bacterium]|nr:regulatory signaling modulator protein AmpE [Gammaproteobacteria bacterium]
MTLIALALGLILEHVATAALHLRELRWFDRYYDAGLALISSWPRWGIYVGLVLIVALPALPVFLISDLLKGEEIIWDLAYLSFAVLIVFFCLGPRDLGSEVDEYCLARDQGDDQAAERVLLEMCESEHPRTNDIEIVEDAIFVQSINRIFGVIFWFVVLGPVGAWIFRVSDLLRRRVVFQHMRRERSNESALVAIEAIYGVLKWIPARLAMCGYALSGSFDDAMNAWRGEIAIDRVPIDVRNDLLVARVGKASMTGYLDEPDNSSAAARNSMRIVHRTVFIWVIVIALLTIFGFAL